MQLAFVGAGAFWAVALLAFASSMGEGLGLKVPRGPEALPKNASTSPFVNIPLTPVPLILSAFVMLFSAKRRCTDGKRGRECCGGP
jgi:hypothetical protein